MPILPILLILSMIWTLCTLFNWHLMTVNLNKTWLLFNTTQEEADSARKWVIISAINMAVWCAVSIVYLEYQ